MHREDRRAQEAVLASLDDLCDGMSCAYDAGVHDHCVKNDVDTSRRTPPQVASQNLCSIIRTLARLTRSRGVNWGANEARHWAKPGHGQPPEAQLNGAPGHMWRLLATAKLCLLSNGSHACIHTIVPVQWHFSSMRADAAESVGSHPDLGSPLQPRQPQRHSVDLGARRATAASRRREARNRSRAWGVYRTPLVDPEDGVHHLGAGTDHWPQLSPVDSLRRRRGAVTHQPGDLLDRHTLFAHDRHKSVPQFPGTPIRADACGLADLTESTPDVGRVERCANRGCEHQAVILPQCTGQQPVLSLLDLVDPQRLYGSQWQTKRSPRLLGLHVATRTYRSPNRYMRRYWRLGIGVAVQVHAVPGQRSSFLGTAACQQG